jgi:hypothetical protein
MDRLFSYTSRTLLLFSREFPTPPPSLRSTSKTKKILQDPEPGRKFRIRQKGPDPDQQHWFTALAVAGAKSGVGSKAK